MKAFTFFILLTALVLLADEGHKHEAGKLGTVKFETSCEAAVRPGFQRGVALLHSFWYEEAEKAFREVARQDPACGMAHWGVAMSNYHPVWAPPNKAELASGWAAAEKAMAVGAKTGREKDYIGAIATFYKDAEKLDHRKRSLAYEAAMAELHRKYPADPEAAIFYGLALLGTAPATDKEYKNQKKAAVILNKELARNPNHPGIAHYVIHSYDYPALAEMALPAARSYAKIAPDSPHALHMPSHIFTRLGLWEESIQSNIASAATAKKHVEHVKPGAGAFDQLHAMDYLTYAYLQMGQDRKARQVLDEMKTIEKLDAENFAAAYAFAAAPARWALERRQWREAMELSLHPAGFPWRNFRYTEAMIIFAQGLGAARSGKIEMARERAAALDEIRKQIAGASGYDWASLVESQRMSVTAWVALLEGRKDEALRTMRASADLEDKTDKHPVTPGAVVPARELLAEMLMESGQGKEALVEFESVLKESPNRFRALHGAGKAAHIAGDKAKANGYYSKLKTLCSKADTKRPEMAEAMAFLSR